MTTLFAAVLIFSGLRENSWSQDGGLKTFPELARYTGSNRERLLYQGAQKEGKLIWYTTLTRHKELARVFEAKFKGVTVEPYRASGATMGYQAHPGDSGETSSHRCRRGAVPDTDGAARKQCSPAL
jgi:hypothetical protein